MMLNSLICGNFQEEEDELELMSLCPEATKSARKPTRRHSFGTTKTKNKNPYADRGLDKFTALLADLDSKRQKIYTQKGSEDISLLGFVYNSSDYKPIVVRVRDKKPTKTFVKSNDQKIDPQVSKVSSDQDSKKSDANIGGDNTNTNTNNNKNRWSLEKIKYSVLGNIKFENLRRPSYYVPVIIILILLFLAIFGKSFAILCTSLGWYVIPTIKSENTKRVIKKKDQVNHNKKKIVAYSNSHEHGQLPSSPTSVLSGNKSPPEGGSPLHPRSFV